MDSLGRCGGTVFLCVCTFCGGILYGNGYYFAGTLAVSSVLTKVKDVLIDS